MHRRYFLAVIAFTIVCIAFIAVVMWRHASALGPQAQPVAHPTPPYKAYIAGLGIIEPSSGNIFIGSPVNRVVDHVFVHVGDSVKKGDMLFMLEDRDLQAELIARQVAYEIAVAQLQRLEVLPRPEDLAIAEAAVTASRAELTLAKVQYEMVQGLQDPRAISQEEVNRRLYAYAQAEAKWKQAQADYDKVKAGTWKPDLTIATLEAMQARANVHRAEAELARTIITSPIEGTVLQMKVHAGEFLPPDTTQTPVLVLGNTDELYLRVSINQFDAPNFRPESPAVAFLQGDVRAEFPLEFVRLEPYFVAKTNLTNALTEKIDTRVLQVLYKITKRDHRVFVGQQMDAFIEAGSSK